MADEKVNKKSKISLLEIIIMGVLLIATLLLIIPSIKSFIHNANDSYAISSANDVSDVYKEYINANAEYSTETFKVFLEDKKLYSNVCLLFDDENYFNPVGFVLYNKSFVLYNDEDLTLSIINNKTDITDSFFNEVYSDVKVWNLSDSGLIE